jgi:arylsulfatase B
MSPPTTYIWLILLLLAILQPTVQAITTSIQRPHIVFAVIDDLGHSDTTLFNNKDVVGYSTPHLDSLVKSDSIMLTNYYTQTVCSPTRSSFMTSLYPFRTGMQHIATIRPAALPTLPLDVPTLPELLSQIGYETHMIGKWHLGAPAIENTPTYRGFQTFYGYTLGAQSYFDKIEVDDFNKTRGIDFWDEVGKTHYKHPDRLSQGTYSLFQYRDRAKAIFQTYVETHPTQEQQNEHPFFLYLAFQSVHIPIEAYNPKDDRCKSSSQERRVYCAMVLELDDAIGDLIHHLKQDSSKLWDNTLLIISTDNGGMLPCTRDPKAAMEDPTLPIPRPGGLGSNFPLRGGKTTLFEGGVRAFACISGGFLHADERGKTFTKLSHAVDLPAFALRAAGYHHSKLKIDGLPLIGIRLRSDDNNDPTPEQKGHEYVPYNIVKGGEDYTAIRFGKWKLIVGTAVGPATVSTWCDGWWPAQLNKLPISPPTRTGKYLLFDIENDPREMVDLSKNFTNIVDQGRKLIAKIIADPEPRKYVEPQGGNFQHIQGLPNKWNGYSWQPWLHRHQKQQSQQSQQPQQLGDDTNIEIDGLVDDDDQLLVF